MRDYQSLLAEFDPVIAERGLHYFETGRIMTLDETVPDSYCATVCGSEDYEVTVTFDEDGEVEFDCDCPYYDAPWCKHVAAVLYALEAGEYRRYNPGTTKDPLSSEALAQRPSAELAEVICAAAKQFPQVRAWFCARLAEPGNDLESWRMLIRNSAKACSHDGYIPYRLVEDALSGTHDALEHLREWADTTDELPAAVDFALMIIDEMRDISDNADDADGMTLSVAGQATEMLAELTENRIVHVGEDVIRGCWHRLMSFVDDTTRSEWSSGLPQICEKLAEVLPALRPEYEDWLLAQLNRSGDAWHTQYAKEKATLRYYDVLARWHGEEAAFAFAMEHLEQEALRVVLFERHCRNRQYQQAIAWCISAEKLTDSQPGLRRQWQERRYNLYVQLSDIPRQRDLARQMLLEGQREYYQQFKALCAADCWPEEYRKLLDDLRITPKHSGIPVYLHILREEKDVPRLLAFVKKNPSTVFGLYHSLKDKYAVELHSLFISQLEQMAKIASSRAEYQNLCEHILTFHNCCGAEPALAFIVGITQQYPRRTAMQDELKQLRQRIITDQNRAR